MTELLGATRDMCDNWLGGPELWCGLLMPRKQAGARWPNNLVQRKVVPLVVPPAIANMLVVLRAWNLNKAANVVVEKCIRWLRKIERLSSLRGISSNCKYLMRDLGRQAEDDELRMAVALKEANGKCIPDMISLRMDADAMPPEGGNVINDLLLAFVLSSRANHACGT